MNPLKMNQTIGLPGACEFLTQHVVSVFETMLSLRTTLSTKTGLPFSAERVTGTAGFGGDNVNGTLYLHLSAATAARFAGAMLQLPSEEIPENEINDAVGEVTNMLIGGLKSWLTNCGAPCAMSTPAIIRGTSFAIETPSDVKSRVLAFESEAGIVAVEIHIRLE